MVHYDKAGQTGEILVRAVGNGVGYPPDNGSLFLTTEGIGGACAETPGAAGPLRQALRFSEHDIPDGCGDAVCRAGI